MTGEDKRRRHFVLGGLASTEAYKSPNRGGRLSIIPERNRTEHGAALAGQLGAIQASLGRAAASPQAAEGAFLRLEFESFPNIELAFESLARERSGIELLNVRLEGQRTFATVFVPEGKLTLFEGMLRDYLEEKKDSRGRPRDHRRLLDAIQAVRIATLRALWTDSPEAFPENEEQSIWWEVWLSVAQGRHPAVSGFRERAEAQGLRVAPGNLDFPERTVVLVFGTPEQMGASILTLNSVSELRRAKETADFFDSLPQGDQAAWLNELLSRTSFVEDGPQVPHACLLDTGVNRGHPLLAPGLAEADVHTLDPAWGMEDQEGHGTAMAGLALCGDLVGLLEGAEIQEIQHRLESVKLLPFDGGNGDDAKHHGYLTTEAVARPEVTSPVRKRVFGMAVTAKDHRDRGRPSAWSAALDRLSADVDGDGANPRLFVVSAGNIQDLNGLANYPATGEAESIQDPAQSWNALTVGASTELVNITEPEAGAFTPIAPLGGLSPFSTTSLTWQSHWPLKPDVVLEGGNAAHDTLGAVQLSSLSLLTTSHTPTSGLFTTANATSAATALATRMAALVMVEYPNLWPETVRGLLVHSAEWTDAMRTQFLPAQGATKGHYLRLVRRCGFGIPSINRALWTIKNSLTMIVQDELLPFRREEGEEPKLREMHLIALPWPREVLEGLGETQVEMRVTLSYFVEPNPSVRGVRSRYRYESHGLRFDVKRALESEARFHGRVNLAARDEEEGSSSGVDNDPFWMLGKQNRHRGSLHSDTWRGSAAELASRGLLAVYPALGWWKLRPRLERFDRRARYALIVSIRAPEVDVDLYTEVANLVGISIET